MAWCLIRDALLALLYDNSRCDAVLSVFLCLRAFRFQQSDQADGRIGSHFGLHADNIEINQLLV